MSITIEPIELNRLAEYARVPMVHEVTSVLDVEECGDTDDRFRLRERPVEPPYTKDYDAYQEGGPLDWPARFDLSPWGLWIAHQDGELVGGAAVAWNAPDVEMLEGRDDLAVLWDIRVRAGSRRRGVGSALFLQAAQWAESKGCNVLNIETQNVNVAACRFYAAMGCVVGRIDRDAYKQHPDVAQEIQLLWYLGLSKERNVEGFSPFIKRAHRT